MRWIMVMWLMVMAWQVFIGLDIPLSRVHATLEAQYTCTTDSECYAQCTERGNEECE